MISTFKAESINKLTADELIIIILQIMKSLSIDIRNITSIESSQKYRIANKIVDELKVIIRPKLVIEKFWYSS